MSEEKPTPPEEWECCGGGCTPCVWDRYYERLHAWHDRQAKTDKSNKPKTGQPDSTGYSGIDPT
ncbi:MAG: hypothetical protein CSB48_10975 [Proteobacteria bacterium]|nr:MAG: hypothetical protein CSB48_10975 [Pseudomonadota bacterium]PIE40061.1 MAG: hypothetical protein CSA51_02740 [Gammaproteobacteria bacterium]